MEPITGTIIRERHEGREVQGHFLLSDVQAGLQQLLETHAGQIKLIYLDPPFQTGDKFVMRVRVGESEWKSGRGSLEMESFNDSLNRSDFLDLMRHVLTACRALLRMDGMLFLHIDYRTHPYLRLMMDEIFGEDNFLNEIIWVYQSGGRSLRHFSRKHDVILFYRRSAQYDFNVEEVMAPPSEPKSNHMRRHVDPDGRIYRSIRANGRVYTYYDDDPVAPTDVWSDLSHLQQRDPERTGYDTQKPLCLLERIVKCGSRKGETVLDPFAGSGTTLEAARKCGRNFIGIDRCALTLNIARRRLEGSAYVLEYPSFEGNPHCQVSVAAGVGFYHITLETFELEADLLKRSFETLDAVDNWSVGYLRGDEYVVMAQSLRTKRSPSLERMLNLPVYSGRMAVCISDVCGRSFCYEINSEEIPSFNTGNGA